MKTISRRNFAKMMGLGTAGILAAPLLLKWSADQGMETLLRHKMRPLIIPDDIMDRFLADFLDYLNESHPYKKYRLHGYDMLLIGNLHNDRFVAGDPGMVHPVEKLVTHFVMSTNIAIDQRVQAGQKEIKYLGFWDTNEPCGNPFANFDFD